MAQNDMNTVFWYFKSGNVWSEESSHEWMKYRDIEMQIIEEAYQQGKSEVLLDRYRIDLKEFIQFNRINASKQRPVRREVGSQRQECLGEERFFTTPLTSNVTYRSVSVWCPLLTEWLQSSDGRKALVDFSTAIDACINGILEEAKKHESNSDTEANWMAEQLRACKTNSRREVSKTCIHLYTRESFLFRVLNTALRENDYSKVNTLGPLSFLIRNYFHTYRGFIGTVYRGVNLSSTEIQMYRKAVSFWYTWPSYTSTSKNRSMADFRGNTLFIIDIVEMTFTTPRAFDISELSYFPSEEEVLLAAGTSFQVISVELDLRQKYIINVKI